MQEEMKTVLRMQKQREAVEIITLVLWLSVGPILTAFLWNDVTAKLGLVRWPYIGFWDAFAFWFLFAGIIKQIRNLWFK